MKELVLRPDAKGRICLGKMASGVSSFKAIFDEKSQTITLEPYMEVPLRERWLFENEEALSLVMRGIEDSKKGRLVDAGSFAQYLTDDEDAL